MGLTFWVTLPPSLPGGWAGSAAFPMGARPSQTLEDLARVSLPHPHSQVVSVLHGRLPHPSRRLLPPLLPRTALTTT